MIFPLKATVTLTFDPKINRGHLLTKANTHVKFEHRGTIRLLGGNDFPIEGHCDLDLWPLDPKINRGHLLTKTDTHVKFKSPGHRGSQVIGRKRFSYWRSPWPWPLTPWPQINSGHLLTKANIHVKFEVRGPKRSLVIGWKRSGTDRPTNGPTSCCKTWRGA